MQKNIENYFLDGCLRCSLGATPECKARIWAEPLHEIRRILKNTELDETIKWGSPCYTYKGKNVILIGAFKENCVISFLKGALLKDAKGLLEKPGENSQSARFLRFTRAKDVTKLETTIKNFVNEAIELEKSGAKVETKKTSPADFPEELTAYFKQDPSLKKAFEALTPGRQRSYLIHIAGAKQSATKTSRIEKCIPKIISGKGFNEY